MPPASEEAVNADFSVRQFYTEVAEVLEDTLANQPQRQDLRLKLLEVYAASGRRDAFTAEAREYLRKLEQGAGGDWGRVEEMGRALLIDEPTVPEEDGKEPGPRRFGEVAGNERLAEQLTRLADDYERIRATPEFLQQVDEDLAELSGRMPVTLYPAERLAADNGGAAIYVAREDAHDAAGWKLANALGQARVARERGCRRLVTGSVSGQQAVAAASAAAHLGLGCTVHMRHADAERNNGRLSLLKRLGAKLRFLKRSGQPDTPEFSRQYAAVLNEVREAALTQWLEAPEKRQFTNGLAAGPEPFPSMLRDFHAGNGRTVRRQIVQAEHKLPDLVVAGIDAGLDAFNLFVPFLGYRSTRLLAVPNRAEREMSPEARSRSENSFTRSHYSDDQVDAAERILRAQGFPSTKREHAWLRSTGRVTYLEELPGEVSQAAEQLARTEGLLVTAESGDALTVALREARRLKPEDVVVVLLKTGVDLEPSLGLDDGRDRSQGLLTDPSAADSP